MWFQPEGGSWCRGCLERPHLGAPARKDCVPPGCPNAIPHCTFQKVQRVHGRQSCGWSWPRTYAKANQTQAQAKAQAKVWPWEQLSGQKLYFGNQHIDVAQDMESWVVSEDRDVLMSDVRLSREKTS